MGYILPINDFQVAQYIKRSLPNKDHYSFIHSVQKTKKHSYFSREIEQRTKRSEIKYGLQKNPKSLHTSSYDKSIAEVTSKGLYYDFYV